MFDHCAALCPNLRDSASTGGGDSRGLLSQFSGGVDQVASGEVQGDGSAEVESCFIKSSA